MKVSYKWLQTFFEEDTLPSVDEVVEKLMFHAYEIEGVEKISGDSVIDVDVLPNRAADSLSHRGIAREISTLFEIPMKHDSLREKVELEPTAGTVKVALSDKDSCSYYIAAYIKGVEIKGSPEWLKTRLEALGQKSINNVVDATNYVLFNLGQPTHVFDAHKLSGENPSIATRLARHGEKIVLLGGEEVELDDTMTVITDANSNEPLAIAGVKGGTLAEVDKSTTDIIIESAHFHPKQTRLTSQVLKLRTDASARFENNVSDTLADYGAYAVTQLILKVAGGELLGYSTAGDLGDKNPEVVVSLAKISKILGAEISESEIENIFNRLQFDYSKNDGDFVVTAPFERRDIKLPEDVIEEVGRVYGYEKIKSIQLDIPEKRPNVHKKFAYSEIIKNTLNSFGITEVYLYSLRDSGEVKLKNALASDKNHLRKDLRTGIIETLDKNERNIPLLGLYDALKIFEIGNVFLKGSEETHVCIGVRVIGKKKKEEKTEVLLGEIKSTLEKALGAKLPEITGKNLEFNLDELIGKLPEIDTYPKVSTINEGVMYKIISQYPFVLRDIAMWVQKNTSTKEVEELIKKHSGNLLKRMDLFDTFEKEGKVSYAFHLVFQSMEETLTDEKVGKFMKNIEEEIDHKDGWEVR